MANHKSLNSLFLDIADSIRSKLGSSSQIIADNFPAAINSISTGSYYIRVGEFNGLTIQLSKDGNILDSKLSSGGIIEFLVNESGTYTITVFDSGTQLWTSNVIISDPGIYYAKGRILNDMTTAQIHDACQLGIASKMFSYRDVWTYTSTGSIMNNMKFLITDFIDNGDGTESIQFWMLYDQYTTTFNINPQIRYITSAAGTTSSVTNSSAGGYKYSVMRQRFMPAGSEIYQQGSGLKNDDSTVVGGIKFSDLKYTDTGLHCPICSYTPSTDSFTELSSLDTQSQSAPYFIKGYFKSLGTLTEDQFNAGIYYTYNVDGGSGNMGTFSYNSATVYDSSTNYYGLYETLQDDGVFYNAFKSLIDAGYLATMELKQSTGINQYSYGSICYDKVAIPSISELVGYIKPVTRADGTRTTTNSYYADPESCHNEKWSGLTYSDIFPGLSGNVWIRSVYSNHAYIFVYLYTYGYFGTNPVESANRVRPCFRFH